MNLSEVTLDELVSRALLELRSPTEIGFALLPEPGALALPTSTTFAVDQLSKINVTDIIEAGYELMQVTAKTEDTITVARGYYGTTAEAHADGPVTVNPQWLRVRVAEGVRRAFPRLEAFRVQLRTSKLMFPVTSMLDERRLVLEIPSEARDVRSVRYGLEEISNWEFLDDVPTSVYSTGKIVRLPRGVGEDTELYVTYTTPYRWSTHPDPPVGSSTIEIPEGAEDLPAQYAAAWCVSKREISRSEIDHIEEWSRSEPLRGGISQSFVRALWQEFYRALDEAMRLDPPPVRQRLQIRSRRWMGV